MSSVLDRPHGNSSGGDWATRDSPRALDRITDDDWGVGEVSTASTQRMTLVGWPTRTRHYRFPFLQGHLVIECEGALPAWFAQTIASLDELGHLESNWDSYGANRIQLSSMLATIELLLCVIADDTPPPAVVPTSRGAVMLEWHTRGVDLEVQVLGRGRFHVAGEDARAGSAWDAEIGSDLSQLVKYINRLADSN